MLSFFNKRTSQPPDFSFLKTDIHSHLIPGIDDGASTIEESITLVKHLVSLGYEKIITTPHIMRDYYPNTPEIIRTGLTTLKTALQNAEINVKIETAAEYYIDDYFETLLADNTELLTFSDNILLIEFSTFSEPANAMDVIFQLRTRGYQPVLHTRNVISTIRHSLKCLTK